MSTSWAEIASPKPVPPKRRVVELSACAKAWKMTCCLSSGNADAGVAHGEMQATCLPARFLYRPARGHEQDHFALFGEFECVADQVDDDLPQPNRIADQIVRHVGIDLVDQLELLLVGPQGHRLHDVIGRLRTG